MTERQQCIKINNIHSNFMEIISGVPQGSILGRIFFKLSSNDLFFFVETASIHKFADDNSLSAWEQNAGNVYDLIAILKSELCSEADLGLLQHPRWSAL